MVKKIMVKTEFLGYKYGDIIPEKDFYPNWIPYVEITDDSFNKELDVNNDGKIDVQDKKIVQSLSSKLTNTLKKKK